MNDVDERVRALRPDALIEDAYRSRREADLARVFATPAGEAAGVSGRVRDGLPRPLPRPAGACGPGSASRTVPPRASRAASRPAWRATSRLGLTRRLVLAGSLAGLAAAVTVPLVTSGTVGLHGPGGGRTSAVVLPDTAGGPTGASTAPGALPATTSGVPEVVLDARSVLLAGARTVARETVTGGRYWFERTRTFEPVGSGAIVAHTDESWYDGRGGRVSSGQDPRVTFGTKRAEAAWKAKGSPALWKKPSTHDFSRLGLLWSVGGETLSMDAVRKLPGEPAELERWLRSAHRKGPFPAFVFDAARYLLSSPASPATRAAMLRILAAQPGLVLAKDVRDPLGRSGFAVTTADGHHRLIVDESGARLLAFAYDGPDEKRRSAPRTVHIPARKGLKIAYEASGWVDELGARE